jgi:hypothetical protein
MNALNLHPDAIAVSHCPQAAASAYDATQPGDTSDLQWHDPAALGDFMNM